ncbi:MAG: 50S ribosomal protein L30 [Nitrospirae bacterium]|nr:50S ribosomal protein L30 [Nitrospirota bacterium]
MLNITQKRSEIGSPEKHRKILAALGLKKPGSSVTKKDNMAIQGMIHKISHLLEVKKIAE